MVKHICAMTAKCGYWGSYGVGDSEEAARKKARKELGEKPAKVQMFTCDVMDGHKLVITQTITGLQWWTEPV